MKLSRKTLLLLTTVSVLSVVASGVVLRSIVYPTFIELENHSAANNTATVEAAIQSQIGSLLIYNQDYSEWDETFNYLQNGGQDYIKENLSAYVMDDLDIDAIVLLNEQGSLDLSVMRGPDNTAVYPPALPFEELEPVIKALYTDNDELQQQSGVLGTSRGPLLLVSSPVTRTNGTGPTTGTVMFIRFLTPSRIDELQVQFNIPFDALPINSAGLPPKLMHKLSAPDFSPGERTSVQESARLLSYKIIPDIVGRPAFVLEVITPRKISNAGNTSANLALLFLALSSLLYLLVSNFSLKRMIVKPISELTRRVGRLQECGDLSERLHSDRNDELGTLTRQIDAFVVELDATQSEITEARDIALEANKAKSEFLATMSHEIRTPINGVLGMTELLLMSKGLSDQQRRYAEAVLHSGDALLGIINDILDISKIESGKLELDNQPFNLRHLVEECLELLAERAHGKGLELHCDIPLGTATHVLGDSARMRQILINLIGNAVKFTEGGEIIVRVLKWDSTAGRPGYRIEVEDTGVGIDSEYTEIIFEPFSQQDSSTTRKFGGTGLGLSICRQLVTLMSGEIGVNSTQGQGSIFWFTVPLTEDENSPVNQPSRTLTGRNVLIIDDNDTGREIFRHQLEGWCMQVQAAFSADEAFGLLHGNSDQSVTFDLILIDVQTSKAESLELAHAIRQEPGCDFVPMVMLSPFSDVGTGKERRKNGLDAWLSKPVGQDHLHDTLATVIGSGATRHCSEDKMKTPADTIHKCESNNLKILVAEDNKINRAVAQGMLQALGHTTSVAENGYEAVAAFQSREFDMVMMDCLMPIMDGFEATCSIRKWEKQNNRTPSVIVAVTANAQQGDQEFCLNAGMDGYLSKPFTIEQLAQILEQLCSTTPAPINGSNEKNSIALNEYPLLESEALEALCKLAGDNGDPGFMLTMTNTYVDQTSKMAADRPRMLNSGDLAAIESAAHKLKS